MLAPAIRPAGRAMKRDLPTAHFLNRELGILAHRLALRKVLPSLLRALKSLKRDLYPYQREGVERFLLSGSLLLGDDMGLGKTAQAIASCHALWHTGHARRGLLIVPASLKGQWEREWKLFTDAPIAVVDGGPLERARLYRRGKGFLVVNYEQVLKDLEGMQGFRPDLVVLDEAQRIKNWETRTAATIKQLQPRYRLVLTGTPFENRLLELGVPLEFALYVLPNAKTLRFVESGSLLALLHKWTLRTCFNAQEEIYLASMDELEQVRAAHPRIGRHIGPPCVIRNGLISPRCTEGSHFCGVPVWKDFPAAVRRL